MDALRTAMVVVCGGAAFAGMPAAAQTSQLDDLPPARAPCTVLDRHPCHPAFCSVFHRGPCFPEALPPLGQTLQLTVLSADGGSANGGMGNHATRKSEDADAAAASARPVATISDMFAALRRCWIPPAKERARHGMEYTIRFAFRRDGELIAPPRKTYSSHDVPEDVRGVYRDAVDAALRRCTPLRFSETMAGAVAGRPIAIRFVDDRTVDGGSAK